MSDQTKVDLKQRVQAELTGNILPFWIKYTVDHEHGGFYGALTNDLQVLNHVPRSAILCARILWTYSAAYRLFKNAEYLTMAQHAYVYLTQRFGDTQFGGVYWLLNAAGEPENDRKQIYAQAFAIYGLTEYYRATGLADSLTWAKKLFELIETHSYDATYGGYLEACNRQWGPIADWRLSSQEPNCPKSMNTLLHVMEAYTNLARVWPNDTLRARLRQLISVVLDQVIDSQTWHFKLFFATDWQALPAHLSYGHDIEGSWLLQEAAEVLAEPALLARAKAAALHMAQAVYTEAILPDGSILDSRQPDGAPASMKEWWVQAEAVVGFLNAYQLSGQPHFWEAAQRCWQFIDTYLVDREHGEWIKGLNLKNKPNAYHPKTGPWECPYHNGRACMEVFTRLSE